MTGGSSGAQSAYQMKFDVTYDSDMQADFDDLRFCKADEVTLLDSWLESKTDSTSAVVWVETDTPANAVDADIYMYYDNSGAASAWDIGNTFLFGDDFPGSSLDTNKWDTTSQGSMVTTVSGNKLRTQCSAGAGKIYSKNKQYGSPVATRFRWRGYPTNHGLISAGFYNFESSYDRASWVAREDIAQWRTRTANNSSNTYSTEGTTGSGSYQNWDILWKSNSEVEYFRDNVSQQVVTTNIPDESNLYFYIDTAKLLNNVDAYFDWVLVRKYAANPATYSFGSEESAPPGNPAWYWEMLKRRNR